MRTFSIAGDAKDDEGEVVTRWMRCREREGRSKLVREGDRLKVKGYFRHRRYEKGGETRSSREIVVKDIWIERQKIREQVA